MHRALSIVSLSVLLLLGSPAPAKIISDIDLTTQVTKSGQNRQPVYVSTGSLLFVSRDREHHKDPQIYLKNLNSGKEKRVTYQRGHIINGAWLEQENTIFYASSTDEEKETPALLKNYLNRFPASIETGFFFHLNVKPTEIYRSHIDGSAIERLSKHIGFDAFPAYIKEKDLLLFSRLKEGKINIFGKNLNKKKPNEKRYVNTHGHDLGIQLSPAANQVVWYRFSPDFKSSQVVMSDANFTDQRYLTMDEGIHWSPYWHPNEKTIVYSARKKSDKSFNLYEVALDKGCHRKITGLRGDEFYPSISPDGTKIAFTSTHSGKEQIHLMDYPNPFRCD